MLLIDKKCFNNYFDILYEIEFSDIYIIENNILIKDSYNPINTYELYEREINHIKDRLEYLFNKTKEKVQIDNKNYRLVYKSDEKIITTEWKQTDNLIELYKYFLFNTTNNNELRYCIDYWFSEGYGYYSLTRSNKNNIKLCRYRGINYIDFEGHILRHIIHEFKYDLPSKIIYDIFTFKKTSDKINFITNKILELNKNFNIKKDINDVKKPIIYYSKYEYIDLIEIFTIFFNNKNFYIESN